MTPVAGQAATRERLLALVADRTPLADEGTKKVFRTKSVYVSTTKQQVNDSLDFILREDDSLAPFVENLMTTGSTPAREMVKCSFSETVNSIARIIDERDSDPEWDAMVPYPYQIMGSFLREWNIGNVADECSIPYSRKSLNAAAVTAQFITARDAGGGDIPDEVYWRGVAALTLSESVSFASSSKGSARFHQMGRGAT